MKVKVICPNCGESSIPVCVDTSGASSGDIFNDIFECPSCKKPSILQTKIKFSTDVLPVVSEPVTETTYTKQRRVKRLLDELGKELS